VKSSLSQNSRLTAMMAAMAAGYQAQTTRGYQGAAAMFYCG